MPRSHASHNQFTRTISDEEMEDQKKYEKARLHSRFMRKRKGKKSKLKDLSLSEQRYVYEIVVNKRHKVEAAILAGYRIPNRAQSQNITNNKLDRKPRVQSAISELMDDLGLDDRTIVRGIKDGMEANKVVMNQKEGEAYETIAPDHQSRLGYLKLAMQAKGMLGGSSRDSGGGAQLQQNNFYLSPGESEELDQDMKQVLLKRYRKKDVSFDQEDIVEGELEESDREQDTSAPE